jgi:hypothetical protein
VQESNLQPSDKINSKFEYRNPKQCAEISKSQTDGLSASGAGRALLAQALQERGWCYGRHRRTAIVGGITSNNDICAPRKRGGGLESVFDIGDWKRKGLASVGCRHWGDLDDVEKPFEEVSAAVFQQVGAVWQGMPRNCALAFVLGPPQNIRAMAEMRFARKRDIEQDLGVDEGLRSSYFSFSSQSFWKSGSPRKGNAPCRDRTYDPVIKSHLLYQLS